MPIAVHNALAVGPDGDALVGLDLELFRVDTSGDVEWTKTLDFPVVEARIDAAGLWVATRKQILLLDDGGATVASYSLQAADVKFITDFDVDADQVWLALGVELRALDAITFAPNWSRTMVAKHIAADGNDGAWVGGLVGLERVNASGTTTVTAQQFPAPSLILGIDAHPLDHGVLAASANTVRRISSSGAIVDSYSASGAQLFLAGHGVSLALDRVQPALTWVGPAAACVDTATPNLVLEATDSWTGINQASLVFATVSGSLSASCSFSGNIATCVPAAIPDGAVTVTATVSDLAEFPNSVSANESFTVDTIDPVVAFDAYETPTNDATITITGTASESGTLTINGTSVTLTAGLTFSHGPLTLVEGSNSFVATLIDCTGTNSGTATATIVLDTVAPDEPEGSLIFVGDPIGGLVDIWGDPGAVEGGATVIVTRLGPGGETVTTQANADGSFFLQISGDWGTAYTIKVQDAAGNTSDSIGASVDTLPPDPALVATEIDPTVPTDMFAAVEFLWDGADPIQTGVTGTIDAFPDAKRQGSYFFPSSVLPSSPRRLASCFSSSPLNFASALLRRALDPCAPMSSILSPPGDAGGPSRGRA